MRDTRDSESGADEALLAQGQVAALLSLPRQGPAAACDASCCGARGRALDHGMGLHGLPIPDGVYASIPVTKAVDSEEGIIRVRGFKGPASIKNVLLSLAVCEYCGEATSDGTDMCESCGYIYGPIEVEDDAD